MSENVPRHRLSEEEAWLIVRAARLNYRKRKREIWVYGFHFKNRKLREMATSRNMQLVEGAASAYIAATLINIIEFSCGRSVEYATVRHRNGKPASIIGLVKVEDATEDERRQMVENITQADIAKLREALSLGPDKNPKWYETFDTYGSNDADSSDDESLEAALQPLKVKV